MIFDDILNIFYPKVCYSCGQRVSHNDRYFCFECANQLPYFNNDSPTVNEFHSRLFNRLALAQAYSLFQYRKQSAVQDLIHDFKYSGLKNIGIHYGGELLGLIRDSSFDYIIPVPMHKDKLRKRGYNQAEVLAREISKGLNVPILTEGVHKLKQGSSQTVYGRLSRWKNTLGMYEISKSLEGLHVLLVDDIFTSGATIESFGNACLRRGVERISVATLAIAM